MATPEQFIVDNTDEDWKALQYVREWCDISSAIDIATGHFEIGAFLALDGAWQKVDKIRLLIGGETSRTTADAIAAALDTSIVVERQTGDASSPASTRSSTASARGKIEIRVYKPKKFHAKAYITHSKLEGGRLGGPRRIVELHPSGPDPERRAQRQVPGARGRRAAGVVRAALGRGRRRSTPSCSSVLEHNAREFTPFEVYAKALHALTANVDPTDKSWEESESVIYPMLAPYQQEAYHALIEMSRRWNGGFLTDGVGLGKTFVGLMLTEYYAVRQRKNVLIMATKTGQDAVWNPELKEKLPDLFGQFSNVIVRWRTPTSRPSRAPTRSSTSPSEPTSSSSTRPTTSGTTARAPTEENPWGSRWWRMHEICKGKTVFLLTATPINNTLFDLVHQAELFTGVDADDYFASIGINSLRKYIVELEKPFKSTQSPTTLTDRRADGQGQAVPVDHPPEQPPVRRRELEGRRRSRGGLPRDAGAPRSSRTTSACSTRRCFDRARDGLQPRDAAVRAADVLPAGVLEPTTDVDTIAENRQRQVVALIRTNFLKRFESSLAAFAGSCLDLSAKVLRWLDVNTKIDPDQESGSPTGAPATSRRCRRSTTGTARPSKRSGTRRTSPRRSSTSSSTTSSAATTSCRR